MSPTKKGTPARKAGKPPTKLTNGQLTRAFYDAYHKGIAERRGGFEMCATVARRLARAGKL